MTERKRLECRNHGNCLWILEYMTSCDGRLPEWDGERHDCAEYEPMPDVRALLALADEMQCDGADAMDDDEWCKPLLYEYAARIREYLGVADA